MIFLLYVIVGLVIGVVSGALGIGGGVLLIPAFVWIFKFDQQMATGTTLAVLVPPIGLLAALEYYRRGKVEWEAALVIAITFIVGAYLGARLAQDLPDATLRLLFGLMLIYVGIRFILHADAAAASALVGVIAVAAAWIGYAALRALGRRHLTAPDLGEQIRTAYPRDRGGMDYYI
jgi:uncharacterized membrane protein YfcA